MTQSQLLNSSQGFWQKTSWLRYFNLRNIALFYFGAPLFIFLLSWFNAPFNYLFAILLVLGIAEAFKGNWASTSAKGISTGRVLTLIYVSLLFAAACGVGGFTPQAGDYNKHNFVFDGLANEQWPLCYRYADGTTINFIYFFGYYLIPAIVAHFFGGGALAIDIASFVWVVLGLCIGFELFLRQFRLPVWALAGLLLFGGMAFLGNLLTQSLGHELTPGTIFLWAAPLRSASIYSISTWSLGYFIPALFMAPLTIGAMQKRKPLQALTWASLAFFWNPFTFITLIPFVAWSFIKERFRGFSWSACFAIGISAILAVAVFYSTKIFPEKMIFLGQYELFWHKYPLFLLFEFGLWMILLDKEEWKEDYIKITALLALAVPFISMGASFDFCFRSLNTVQVVLAGAVLYSYIKRPNFKKTLLLPIFLGFALISGLSERNGSDPSDPQPLTENTINSQSTSWRQEYRYWLDSLNAISKQYLGDKEKNYFSSLLLKTSDRPALLKNRWQEAQIFCELGTGYLGHDCKYESNDRHARVHHLRGSPARIFLKSNDFPRRVVLYVKVSFCNDESGEVIVTKKLASADDKISLNPKLDRFLSGSKMYFEKKPTIPELPHGDHKRYTIPKEGLPIEISFVVPTEYIEISFWKADSPNILTDDVFDITDAYLHLPYSYKPNKDAVRIEL